MSTGLKAVITPVTPFEQNCSLIWCEKTKKAALVDPGGDFDKIAPVIEREGLTLEKILLTHGHLDHCAATHDLSEQFSLPVEGPHKDDDFWISQLEEQATRFGFGHAKVFTPDRWLENNDTVTVGDLVLDVRHCPGHTPGHVIFFHKPSKLAFVGDVLFQGSIGRTDFPRGNHQDLLDSIKRELWPLGSDVQFVPGHGPMSTFGHERQTNQYVADRVLG